MKVLGIQTSPNPDGLTAQAAKAALEGAAAAGAETELIALTQLDVQSCRQCNDGWGICITESECVIEDDFHQVRSKIMDADAIVLSTPTYFGDVSEVTKSFFDRLRRTAMWPGGPHTKGVWVLAIAAPGGSGGGGPSTLVSLEAYYGVCQMPTFDQLIFTQRNRHYMMKTGWQAGNALVKYAQKQASADQASQ